MASAATAEEMLTQAKSLPLREKLRLIEGLARQVADATPEPPSAAPPQSLRSNLIDVLLSAPNVGEDADFERIQDVGRPGIEWDT